MHASKAHSSTQQAHPLASILEKCKLTFTQKPAHEFSNSCVPNNPTRKQPRCPSGGWFHTLVQACRGIPLGTMKEWTIDTYTVTLQSIMLNEKPSPQRLFIPWLHSHYILEMTKYRHEGQIGGCQGLGSRCWVGGKWVWHWKANRRGLGWQRSTVDCFLSHQCHSPACGTESQFCELLLEGETG